MIMFIYKITNKVNGKIYIGLTSNTIKSRFSCHIRDSKTAKKGIDAAIRKYGKENFIVEEIDTAHTIEELNSKEQYWIAFYNSTNNKIGYNQTLGGGGSTGYHHDEETKYKCGNSFRGKHRIVSKERAEYQRMIMTGKKYSEETKQKHSEKMKLAYKEGRRIPNCKGVGGRKPMSEEEKKFNSESQIGKRWLHNDSLKFNLIVYANEIENFINNGWVLKKVKDYKVISRKEARKMNLL